MNKYRTIINKLFDRGKFQRVNYDILVKANFRVFQPLVSELLTNPDAGIRETCAEILGERRSSKAIPFLIKAITDECLFVRHDAFWAIEKICRYEPGALSGWLDVVYDDPKDMKKKIMKWWRSNRRFIEGNDRLS
jgi:hypothetical protein